jgi:hypothetical protein
VAAPRGIHQVFRPDGRLLTVTSRRMCTNPPGLAARRLAGDSSDAPRTAAAHRGLAGAAGHPVADLGQAALRERARRDVALKEAMPTGCAWGNGR